MSLRLLVFILCSVFTLAASAEPVCVTKANVGLRKGPGSQYPVSWTVPRFMPLFKIDRKGAWYKVEDLEGDIHWVAANAVTTKTNCAVVKTKTAKLRTGPGADQPLATLSSVDKYTAFRKVDRDGEWVQVEDDYKGLYWVHETNVWIPMSRAKVTF